MISSIFFDDNEIRSMDEIKERTSASPFSALVCDCCDNFEATNAFSAFNLTMALSSSRAVTVSSSVLADCDDEFDNSRPDAAIEKTVAVILFPIPSISPTVVSCNLMNWEQNDSHCLLDGGI